MRNFKFPTILMLIAFASFTVFMSCSESTSSKDSEYELLVEYLEGEGGDYVNTLAPAIKTAEYVRTNMTSGTQYLIDIRAAADFATGHVDGAENVPLSNLITHVEELTTSPNEIIIICYSGQSAAFGTAMLRLLGHDNVYSMKFGMSSWHSDFDVWTGKLANTYALDFETTSNPVGEEQDAPEINTGSDDPEEILRARVEAVLAEGFGAAAIGASDVMANTSNYYIVNYWPEAEYLDPGHIAGAYCYLPKTDLHSETLLNTLPADETIVIYCYTGQTSANIAFFLKVLGYDAKSLKFGANGMIYDSMTKGTFSAGAIMDYEYVTGN